MNIDPETHREIIIVRRGREREEGHHGGVWKIAYADFMTAMMAFFLVMWLINAANEETKAAVAAYFNPVKLMDRQSRPKGIEETENQEGKVRFESPDATDPETKSARNEKAGSITVPDKRRTADFQRSLCGACRNRDRFRRPAKSFARKARAVPIVLVHRQALRAATPIATHSIPITGRPMWRMRFFR